MVGALIVGDTDVRPMVLKHGFVARSQSHAVGAMG